ncbi:MAG: hypothetical protein PHP65_00290 [Bacilli bacterium]|nr:hypothetical protein [Bacilli bacterium]
MKKLNLFIIFFVISLAIVGLIALFSQEQQSFRLTTLPKSYSLISRVDEKEKISILLYFDVSNLPFDPYDKQIHFSLRDKNNENSLPLKLESTIFTDESLEIQGDLFYLYEFLFVIDFTTNSAYDIEFVEAYLVINRNPDQAEVKLLIGNLSFTKVDSFLNSHFSITKLKATVNVLQHTKSVVAFEIGIRNSLNENVEILEVYPLLPQVQVSVNDVFEITNLNYSSSTNIEELLGYEYHVLGISNNDLLNIVLLGKEEQCYYFPLKISSQFKVTQFAIKMKYQVGDELFEGYIDDFVFFSEYFISQAEINQMVIHTYEID